MTDRTIANTGESSLPGILLLGYACACLALALYLGSTSIKLPPKPEPIKVTTLPDFAAIRDTRAKKTAFFDYLRPAVDAQNRRMREIRARLKSLQAQLRNGESLTEEQLQFLQAEAKRFRLKPASIEQQLDHLLVRADEIPSAMVLTQAAIESAWGTSRFAREANNLFGQWCFKPGCGLVPKRRPAGAKYEVQTFNTVEDAIAGYFLNINTHAAYRHLRSLRVQARLEDRPLKAYELVAGLEKYSERGEHYIDELRNMIVGNRLEKAPPVVATQETILAVGGKKPLADNEKPLADGEAPSSEGLKVLAATTESTETAGSAFPQDPSDDTISTTESAPDAEEAAVDNGVISDS